MENKFGVFVDEGHSKLPTLYWLPKLHNDTMRHVLLLILGMYYYGVVYTFDFLPHCN